MQDWCTLLVLSTLIAENRVESANLHLDINYNQLDVRVCMTRLEIGLHLAKVLLERKHYLVVLYVTVGQEWISGALMRHF